MRAFGAPVPSVFVRYRMDWEVDKSLTWESTPIMTLARYLYSLPRPSHVITVELSERAAYGSR